MAGGRPATGKQQRYPELEELASWFHRALADAGYRSVHEFLSRGLFEKNAVYGVFGAEPSLSSVYVRQQVRVRVAINRSEREDTTAGRPTAEESPASTGPQVAMSVPNALEQHKNLLVTGEPGAGKSTMSSYLARSLSRLWLRKDSAVDAPITEPVVPLRVSARSLDGSGSWSAVLAEAACHSLGRSLLENPDPGLFAGRVQGTRWLVLVDGLDEIPDPRLRGDVIRSVAQHARPDSDYRFVVTTRALPESELAPLRTATVGSYVIEPFGRPELEEFATKWFTVQQVPSPAAETERFLRETSDGRLRELVAQPAAGHNRRGERRQGPGQTPARQPNQPV